MLPIRKLMNNLINILILCTIIINCETVHFTNSPNYFVRKKNYTTYKLEVPGSNSITIIEANTQQPFNKSNENYNSGSILETENTLNKKTVYAPSLLEKFMNEYNIKVSTHLQSKSKHDSTSNNNINRIVKRNDDDYIETEDNYHNQNHNYYENRPQSSSTLTTSKKNDNPFNEKEGWVTLQAVPWSKSKVSKWKPKADIKPVNGGGYNLYQSDQESSYGLNNNDHNIMTSQSNYDNLKPNFYDNDDEYTNNKNYNDNRRSTSKPATVPWNTQSSNYEKPQIEVAPNYDRWYDYGFRPDLENRFENKPPLPKPTIQQQQQQQHYYSNNNRYTNNNNNHDDINNDAYNSNRNSNRYPKPYSYTDQITSSESQYSNHFVNRHPITHPLNGKGEWVLVSTTKGYQHPSPTRSVPRGIKFNNPNTDSSSTLQSVLSQQPTNYRTHKSIKLTVLPAKTEDGKLKPMKLSHGGLLEVESSSQSVEDSAAALKNKKKKVVKRKASMVPMQFVPITTGQKIDRTAVLAAVGAGMVPASMAMLMPLVLGRKKRSLLNTKVGANDKIFNYENILNNRKTLLQY